MKKKNVIVLLILFFSASAISAQAVNNVQFPPSTKWKQIETNYLILIFPEELESKAAEIAAMLDSFYPADQYSLDTRVGKWPVIINNTLINTNGYVMGAPRHSQLYTIPSQEGFNGTNDWLPFLWSHELRHIVQDEKMMRGFTLFAHWIAGEYGSSGMPNFAVPKWAWEGDAVLTETLLSTGGRGRMPGFEKEMRTNLLNGIRWNYYKAGLGYYASYNSIVPSWYTMGYYLSTYIRKVYGIESFNRILEISADFSFVPLIFNAAVKNVTGRSVTDIYEDCLNDLTAQWSEQLDNRRPTGVKTLVPAEADKLSDYYPLGEFDNGDIAALKTSAADIHSLVRINKNGKEKLLKKINPIDSNISFNGSDFCWSESVRDIRWGNLSWAAIRIYSPDEKTYRLLTKKSRYLSPSISPDGSRIAAVEITDDLRTNLVILNAANGRLISKTAEPSGATASETCWTDDGMNIVYIRQQNWMKSLRVFNPDLKTNRALTEASVFNIRNPEADGNLIYFISERSGIEDIWAADLTANRTFRVAAATYGADSPAAGSGRLLFSDYTPDGFSIASLELKDIDAAADEPETVTEEETHVNYFDGLEDEEKYYGFSGPGFYSRQETNDYTVKDYYPALGLFNLHSRSLDTSLSGTGIVITLLANSILNYSDGKLYAGYDHSERELVAGISGSWAGFYPILIGGAEIQSPSQAFSSEFESIVYGGLWLPLDFSRDIHRNTLRISSIFQMGNNLYPYFSTETAVQSSFSWSLTRKMAKRDLVPPIGLSLSGEWYYSINPAYYNFVFGEIKIYLPGILENHGLYLNLQVDWNIDSAPFDKKPAEIPRGLDSDDYRVPLMYNTSIDYIFPVAYPDIALGGFIYIPRFYIDCFLDTAFIINGKTEILQTTGIEFMTEFHLFNSYVPLTAGLRLIYNTVSGGIRIEDTALSLGINLI